jgi:hypothetical protein
MLPQKHVPIPLQAGGLVPHADLFSTHFDRRALRTVAVSRLATFPLALAMTVGLPVILLLLS